MSSFCAAWFGLKVLLIPSEKREFYRRLVPPSDSATGGDRDSLPCLPRVRPRVTAARAVAERLVEARLRNSACPRETPHARSCSGAMGSAFLLLPLLLHSRPLLHPQSSPATKDSRPRPLSFSSPLPPALPRSCPLQVHQFHHLLSHDLRPIPLASRPRRCPHWTP